MIDFDSLSKKSCYNCYWFMPDSAIQCGLVSIHCASSPESGDGSKPLFTDLVKGLNLIIQREEMKGGV